MIGNEYGGNRKDGYPIKTSALRLSLSTEAV